MSFRKMLSALITACAMLVAWSPLPASAVSMTLQTANNITGNQAYSGVGVRFAVDSAVSVSELGIYDSDQDGIAASPTAPLSAYLLTGAGDVVASITFDSTSQGILDAASKYRFKSITPVTLLPGTYTLAGYGWSEADLEHNCVFDAVCETFNTGGGLLTYIDSPFGGGIDPAGTLPTLSLGPGTSNFFSAANIRFDVATTTVPEPSTYLLFATGFLGLLGYGWRRKRTA